MLAVRCTRLPVPFPAVPCSLEPLSNIPATNAVVTVRRLGPPPSQLEFARCRLLVPLLIVVWNVVCHRREIARRVSAVAESNSRGADQRSSDPCSNLACLPPKLPPHRLGEIPSAAALILSRKRGFSKMSNGVRIRRPSTSPRLSSRGAALPAFSLLASER